MFGESEFEVVHWMDCFKRAARIVAAIPDGLPLTLASDPSVVRGGCAGVVQGGVGLVCAGGRGLWW